MAAVGGGGFDMDRGVKMIIIQAHIDVQKHDLGGEGDTPREFDG